uniref:Extracellular calcium-sensing receptor-like n=1 Tax=Erpetoichthys calabaricus TaxID=27687 RepID=A0A8C4SGU0_ERPCA
ISTWTPTICCFLTLIMNVNVVKPPLCKIKETFQLNELHRKGDVMLGGIFEISFKTIMPEMSFTSKPEQWTCERFDISVFQTAQTMVFAIEEINKDLTLLPNITLGYSLYDNCMHLPVALRAAVALVSGLDEVISDVSCEGMPPVLAIVGDPASTNTIAISRITSLFHIPLVSYYATCPCLSNKKEYPSFFRTIPSDTFQVKAMVEIIKHYGWTWVGILVSNDDYGLYALKIFNEEVNKFGCISFAEIIPNASEEKKLLQVASIIKTSTAKVIVAFSGGTNLFPLAKEIVRQNITGRQWIASESWSFPVEIATKENFGSYGGTIGIAIRRGHIPGFQKFLLQAQPEPGLSNNLINLFWEKMFTCKFPTNTKKQNSSNAFRLCTGEEDLKNTTSAYSDVSEIRASYNVYKSVYVLAHALHDLMSCENGKGPFRDNSCADIHRVQPWQLLHYIKKVNFTNHLRDRVAFDENGDAVGIYDIVNWQLTADGNVEIKTVGVFDESAPSGKELFLEEDQIFWNFNSHKVRSVCSQSCQPGTRKASRKGEPICCFDCVQCAEGEITNEIADFWSNKERNQCVLKEIDFLSYEDTMGIVLTSTTSLGVCLSVGVLLVFIRYRNTPVVKANNSELSFLLLVSLTLCFLCALCFIGPPSHFTCALRHVAFGISFVLCISCILVKTIVVIMAFKATLPGNNMMKWFGAAQQRGSVLFFTFIQSLICIVWLSTSPPIPSKNTKYQNAKIIFECDVGSVTGFSCLLGYIGFLACFCFALAFLARNLPDTFNEAKFITFSMLIFCAVWVSFIPAYISSPGKYTVAVEVFAILASSFGLLFAIFAPKCYIILLKPEKNTKRALMGRQA